MDVVSGLTAAAVVIPKAMAYATIAGLPVQVGLYTAFLPMLIYSVLGTSRPLSVSTSTTLAILTAAQLVQIVPDGNPASLIITTATLTILVGAILIGARLLRLGFIANFISDPVLIGFKGGTGLVIILDQVPKLLGIHFHKGGFVHDVLAIFQAIPHTSLPTLAVGLLMIVLLVGIEQKISWLPAPLIAVAAGIAGFSLFGLQAHGVESVGWIPQSLPALTLPDFSLIPRLWPGALAIALMSFTETVAAGRTFATSEEPQVRPNQELLATGLGNAFGALLGAMPSGGGATQTAVNRLAGARTQLAELITAMASLLTMLLLAPLIGRLPEATLAAVVIVYSTGLIRPSEFRTLREVRQTEFLWAVTALVGVVLLGTLDGILVAIVVSLVALAHQETSPPIYVLGRKPGTNVFRPLSSEHPEDETFPGLLIVRLEGRLFFANVEYITEKLKPLVDRKKPKVLMVDLSGAPDLEYTALKMLIEAEKKERGRGVELWLVGLNQEVLSVIRRSSLGKILGRDRMYFDLEQAVAKYLESSHWLAPIPLPSEAG
ncbi:MAG: SulP family inorganic anion transporter [Syntrophobacteraceae bacterium]|nr:SulP family inorganic anion transporter [Syntrophobacteraceae bacterium]